MKGHAAGSGTEAVINMCVKHSFSTTAAHLWCRVEEIAKKKDVSMAQVALAWAMARSTAPIIGTTSLKNLEDSLGVSACARILCPNNSSPAAVKVSLSEEDIKSLEEPYVARSILGHV